MHAEAEQLREERRPAVRRSTLRLTARAVRVHQWVKNLLVFTPTLLAYRFLEPEPIGASLLAFLSFSFGASAVYVLNDLLDIEADRRHARKRHRPFASGELKTGYGLALIVVLFAASLALALALPLNFLLLLVLYFAVTTVYSLSLKQVVLVDILVLAGLYTLRIMGGSAASGVVVSEWLLAFSMFLFLSLAAVKRYAELLRFRADGPGSATATVARRGYMAGDTELVMQMGLSSGYIAVLVLALYITSHAVASSYERPAVLWFACPLMLFWVSRVWLLAHRGIVQDDPLSFAVRDPLTWLIAAIGGAVMLLARGALV
jgi:4-hydroxybenzoate polyprenyltransferase